MVVTRYMMGGAGGEVGRGDTELAISLVLQNGFVHATYVKEVGQYKNVDLSEVKPCTVSVV